MHVQSWALLLPFLYCCCCSIGIAHSSIVPGDDEISALLSIKASLTDPLDHLKDWKKKPAATNSWPPPSPHCNWTGIVCSPKGLVHKLDLSNMNLTGRVSEDIQLLTSLSSIRLSSNGFSSPLPATISNLGSLTSIDLSQNLFDGDFPAGLLRHPLAGVLTSINASGNSFTGFLPGDLGNVSSLVSLDLRGAFFQGPIPKSFKNLKRLKFLGLSGNNLTGELPPELGHLSSLETLILGYNQFSGGVPVEFGNLTNLRYLDLAVGNLGGLIPAELGKLKQLHTVFWYKNSFRGKIPASIGNMTSLSALDLSDNSLSGEIPREMSELENLQLLNLMCNDLTGSIPVGVGNMPRLQVLELWNNTLSGPLPRDLGLHSPLQWLDVSSNALSGDIPAGLCSAGSLTKVILFNNAFSGPIPANLSACGSLVRARLQNNAISGAIPAGFGGLGKLRRLELASNAISGEIPGDIAASLSLSFIDISRNRLRSSLPSTVLSIPSLQSFMASDNDLEGSLPDQFQDCPSLSVLDLSSNCLSGVIPASIASCHRLVNLNLRSNQLTGEIPRAIAKLPTLAILDLSNNSLTGGISDGFGESPTLETLDVSNNRLKGPVPASGMLRTINPNELSGNAGLCGGVLPPCSPYPSLRRPKDAKLILVWWLIGVSVVLATGLVAFGARSFYQRVYLNWSCFAFDERINVGNEDWPWRLMAFQRLSFTSSDILACIKESNVIGMGATGVVYKAEMPQLNTVVAVKKLWRSGTADAGASGSSSTNSEAFVWEANLLGRLRHRNIVRLLGLLHNNADVMIVYEFMQNGNLGEALHGKQATGGLLVDWVSRYNVAVGVAHGLAYLHHDCHPPIIHRDIKSNNVLLDANLEPRIADFGLARMMIQENESVSMVAGSFGYIAPEYGYTLKIDEKSDIYSFGVILLELITGRRPLDPEFGEYVNIVEWIQWKVRNSRPLEEALDPSIGGTCEHVQEEMLPILGIALLCTTKLPRDRPSMKDVITMLGGAKPQRKSSGNSSSSASEEKEMESPVFSTSPVHALL